MPKYIDADEFVRLKREWYCEQCQKRKGMKRGKLQFVYEIGDAPCRACDVDDVISDIDEFPAADVEPKRKTGHWVYKHRTQVHYHKETGEDVINGEKRTVMVYSDLSGKYPHCPYCDALAADSFMNYCPRCGAELLPEPPKEEEDEHL